MISHLKLDDWWVWYEEILDTFHFSKAEDQRAADILSKLIKNNFVNADQLATSFKAKPAIVFGAGPSLSNDLEKIRGTSLLGECTVISADGATSALLKIARKTPDLVVSDLDGNIEDLLKVSKLGSTMVIHAHGDNIEQLEKYAAKLQRVLGTTQVEPRERVYNFGGFTDGDRCVFLASWVGATSIAVAGMDLGETIGTYSKKKVKSVEVKRMKLRFCKRLLEYASSKRKDFYNLTSGGENIRNYRRISPTEFQRIIRR